jgi:hypothetical protein
MNALSHPIQRATVDRSGWEYADYLAEARKRQPVDGMNSKFCRATQEQLARADADISWRLVKARRRMIAARELEKIA